MIQKCVSRGGEYMSMRLRRWKSIPFNDSLRACRVVQYDSETQKGGRILVHRVQSDFSTTLPLVCRRAGRSNV
jgi:hypothetical protein